MATNIQELKSTLHERGMRMTPQRQLVLDALLDLEHATPEQVCQHVQRSTPSVNITTIYRTLELLEDLGIVRHTHLGHGAPNYSVHEHQHVHLVCHRCDTVIEAPCELMDELRGTLRSRFGFALDASHLALSGLCEKCRERSDGAGAVWTDEHGGPARNEPWASARRREDGVVSGGARATVDTEGDSR